MTKKKSLLWEIKRDNLSKGYLFGTMHVSGKVAFSNFDYIYNIIDKCDCLATEISLDIDTQKELGKHMKLPKNARLSELLSEKKYLNYSNELQKYFDLSIEPFNSLMPLFLINFITQKSLIQDASQLNQSMDAECWLYAKNNNLRMESVESLDDHINTLYSIPLTYQLKALKSALSNLPKFKKKAKKMLEVYMSQDIHKLYKTSKKSIGEIKKVLLFDRNIKMAQRIDEICDQHKTFFAFGAGHLAGEIGIIRLLKQKGYTIQPLRSAKELHATST